MSVSYVMFSNYTTGAVLGGTGTSGWTQLDDPDQVQALAASLVTAQADRTTPSFSLTLDSSGVGAQLQQAALAGTSLKAEIAVYDDQGRLTQDYTFGVVNPASDLTDQSQTPTDTVALGVANYSLSTTTYDPQSGVAGTTTSGYDYAARTSILAPGPRAPAPPSAPATQASVAAAAQADALPTNVDTYLVFQLADSSYLTSENPIYLSATDNSRLDAGIQPQNFFETNDVAISFADVPAGASTSPTVLLSFEHILDTASPQLFQMLASGTAFKQVEVVQRSVGSSGSIVSVTKFQNVYLTGETFQQDDTVGTVFEAQADAGFTTTRYNSAGQPVSGSYTIPGGSNATGPTSTLKALPADSAGAGAKDLFFTLPSSSGAVSALVQSANFSIDNNAQGLDFGELTVTFGTQPSADILNALASGTAISNLLLQSTKSLAGGTDPLYNTFDFKVATVQNGPVIADNGDGTQSYTYTFDFRAMRETYQKQNNDGSFDPPRTAEWSRVLNQGSSSSSSGPSAPAATVEPPVALPDSYSLAANTTLTVTGTGLLANDKNASDITTSLVNRPQDGVLTFNSDGSFAYTPNTGFIGTDSFRYEITNPNYSDATLKTSISTVTLTVTDPNAAPAGAGETVTTAPNTSVAITQFDLTGAHALQAVEIASLPTDGMLTDNGRAVTAGDFVSAGDIANGLFLYTPNADNDGSHDDAFTFQVQDGGGTVGRSSVDPLPRTYTLSVVDPGAPVGLDEGLATTPNTPVVIDQFDYSYNSNDNFELAGVEITLLPTAGVLTDNGQAVRAGQVISADDIANSLLVYTPAPDVTGGDDFTFQVEINDSGRPVTVIDPRPRTYSLTVEPTFAIHGETFAAPGMTVIPGQTVTFSIDLGQTPTVTDHGFGLPYLTLDDGGNAVFAGVSGTALSFAYTVQPGDHSTGLRAVYLNLPTGTTIQSGNQDANLTAFAPIYTNVIVSAVACYCPGTAIGTPAGEAAIETLAIGDLVTTPNGPRPIKWIGRRSYAGRFVAGDRDILPVCIKAGALGSNEPRRDLWISPHHAMLLDGMLIAAKDLVNGRSIIQAERAEAVAYIHIELATHDVVLAEGAWSETYLDEGNRLMFHNGAAYCELHPEGPDLAATYCAPRREDGYAVEAVRQRLATSATGLIREVGPPAAA